jgi:hypothetical protein
VGDHRRDSRHSDRGDSLRDHRRCRGGPPVAAANGGLSIKRSTVDAAAAALVYALVTLAVTWPLARDLSRNVAGDYGDPLFNTWALAWDVAHMAGAGWWNANIFAPHPLALAYSDHLAAQALQVMPVVWLSRSPLLAYNLCLLSTFVVSGVGMFLLARELTGNVAAAFVAGLAFAFTPYRIGALSHLTVLSSAWMPFVLLGFRRHFESRRVLPLACASLAWIAQNLSSGYYLLFFSPVVLFYLAWELTTRALWRERRVIATLVVAGAAVALVTAPFVWPYLQVRAMGFVPRSLEETQQFSADVYGYLTADIHLRLWGSLFRAWPRAEGSLFPGLTVILLAIYAASRNARPIVVAPLAVIVPLLLGFTIRVPGLRIASLSRVLIVCGAGAGAILIASGGARQRLAVWLRSPEGFFALITAFAVVMSFGPEIHAGGRVVLDTNAYAFFYRFVPGFDGLRVPARFAMIAAFGVAILAAYALARLGHRWIAVASAVLVVAESIGTPVPLNQTSSSYVRAGLRPLPPLDPAAPPIYQSVAALPPQSVLLEMPLGEPAFDLRYMFFSTSHWRRLVNGYSGGFPSDYERLDQALQDVGIRPDRAWTTLQQISPPTHVLVHERYYDGERGPQVTAWIRVHGGREIATAPGDRLFALHPLPEPRIPD